MFTDLQIYNLTMHKTLNNIRLKIKTNQKHKTFDANLT